MAAPQYPPFDKNGVELAIGDIVRGVTSNSNGEEVTGTIDEFRLNNPLNLRLQVGEIQKNDRGDLVSGYHYCSSDYMEKHEEKKSRTSSSETGSSTSAPAREK